MNEFSGALNREPAFVKFPFFSLLAMTPFSVGNQASNDLQKLFHMKL